MDHIKGQGPVEQFNLPEWETTPRHRGEKKPIMSRPTLKARVLALYDRFLPPHRRYCGLSRKIATIIFLVILAATIALIIGLAVGLSHQSSNHKTLPLGSQTHTGDLTYYGTGLGACGMTSSDNDNIVSISHIVFDAASNGSDPNANPLCRHKLRAVRDGKSVDLTVVDRCVGCKATDLDVSPGAFDKLAAMSLGRVQVTWAWLPPVPDS